LYINFTLLELLQFLAHHNLQLFSSYSWKFFQQNWSSMIPADELTFKVAYVCDLMQLSVKRCAKIYVWFMQAISSYWSPSCTRRLRTTWNGRSSRPRYVCSILSSGCVESNLGMQNACVELCLSRTACSIDSVNLCVLLCSN